MQEQHEQEPPDLVRELEVVLVLRRSRHEVERHDQDEQHDRRGALGEHEQQHGGHPTAGVGRVTIRAKLYLAILLTVIGPVVTIAVALHGMDRLGDRFDEVQERADQRALALDLKFGVTDFNGWQTAYGYDDGASRPRFEHSVRQFRIDIGAARNELTDAARDAPAREIGGGSSSSWRSTTWRTPR